MTFTKIISSVPNIDSLAKAVVRFCRAIPHLYPFSPARPFLQLSIFVAFDREDLELQQSYSTNRILV